jgi:hypothetical protein
MGSKNANCVKRLAGGEGTVLSHTRTAGRRRVDDLHASREDARTAGTVPSWEESQTQQPNSARQSEKSGDRQVSRRVKEGKHGRQVAIRPPEAHRTDRAVMCAF